MAKIGNRKLEEANSFAYKYHSNCYSLRSLIAKNALHTSNERQFNWLVNCSSFISLLTKLNLPANNDNDNENSTVN